ncbi:hypothetical protein ACFL6F_02010 [Planctomycetota bacterium]
MSSKFIPLLIKNLMRSRTRLIVTVGACAFAAFIVCFFLAADYSLTSMLHIAGDSDNLIVTQKDRY